jgi:hypothetical protein
LRATDNKKDIAMGRKRKVKRRANKVSRFPVEPWQPFLDFLNGTLEGAGHPYLVSLDMPLRMLPQGGGEEGEPCEEGFLGALAEQRRKLLSVVDALLVHNPESFFLLEAGTAPTVMSELVKSALADAKLSLIVGEYCQMSKAGPTPWIRFPHFGDVAVVLLRRLLEASQEWRLRRCGCGRYFLKRTARRQDYCSDDCRYDCYNEEKKKKRKRKEKTLRRLTTEWGGQPIEVPEGDGRRNDGCPYYRKCLDEVLNVRPHWTDSSCAECPHRNSRARS